MDIRIENKKTWEEIKTVATNIEVETVDNSFSFKIPSTFNSHRTETLSGESVPQKVMLVSI